MTFFYSQIKWKQRKSTIVSFACICLFVLLLFLRLDFNHSSTSYNSNQYTRQQQQDLATWPSQLSTAAHRRQSLYTPSMFIPDALKHNHFRPIIAVILRTTDDQGIYHIVDHLHKYPFIKEIYIYNLVSNHPLSTQSFKRPNPWLLHKVDIHVIEETKQDHEGALALFSTCALASYAGCYIQDDRSLNMHMDTLYTHSMRHPDLIHVNARSEEYHTHRRWQLFHQDGDLDIHTGYANVRYGAVIPREKAQLFVNQFAVQKPLLYLADVYFPFWTNSYPYILSNPLPLAPHPNPPYHQMLNAVRRLKNALADNSPYFVKSDIELPLDQRDVRTACENDKCLFVTNMDPFPLATEYNSNQNLTHSSLGSATSWNDELEREIPGPEFWRHRGYHAAVDGDSATCWNTFTAPKEGDYFGLDLIGDMRASRLLIQLRHAMEQDVQDVFTIRARNKDGWGDCAITPDSTQSLPRRMVYQMNCPDGKPISAIRLFFTQTQQRPFDLCTFGLDNFIV